MRYRNFDLEAFDYHGTGDVGTFRVRVADSPVGEQKLVDSETVILQAELRQRLKRLVAEGLALPELIAIGEALAALLFPPRVRALLIRSREKLNPDECLRIRLKLDTYALADLPWEYVYIARSDIPSDQKGPDGFLVLDRLLSVVRYEVQTQAATSLDPLDASQLRMVMLLASPDDPAFPPLNLDIERDYIREALHDIPSIQVEFYPDATIEKLQDALTRPAHIFHFAGHGGFTGDLGTAYGSLEGKGVLVLLKENRRVNFFPAERLALNLADRGVRLAVLGACESGRRNEVNPWSGIVPALALARIPAVVGMQYTIADDNAVAFSRRFYRALAAGQPIDAAITDGRLAVFNRGGDDERDWGVPVLYLRSDEGVLFPKAQVVTQETTWQSVLQRSRDQTDRFLREARGTPVHQGIFVPEVYQHREVLESELSRFISNPAQAFVLTGDSGVGKSNLLSQWALDLQSQGHGVFYYDCGGSLELDIAHAVAQDLGLSNADELPMSLERIGELAEGAARQFVIIFDGLNAFRGAGGIGPQALLKNIDAMVGRLPDRNVHLVLSCTMPTWKQLERQGALDLFWSRYYRSGTGAQVVGLDLFTAPELAAAFERYRDYFQLQTRLEELSPATRERLRHPLLLRMVAEAYRGRSEAIKDEGLALGIYRRYYDERVKRLQDQVFAADIAAEMLAQRKITLRIDQLARNDKFRATILSNEPDSSYRYLLDAGILTETPGALFEGDGIKFTYPGVAAYAIARRILAEQNSFAEQISKLVRASLDFPLAWEIAKTLLLLARDTDLLVNVARSTDIELRELAVSALVELYGDQPALTVQIVKQILQTDSEEARRSGLKAAYLIGKGAREVFIWAASKGSPELRQAAKYTLYLIWRTDPAFTFDLLNDLVARINLGALLDLRNIVEFVIDLPTTIFINHCERDDLARQITDLHYRMIKEKLHADLLSTGFLGPSAEELMIKIVTNSFSKPLLDSLLFTEFVPTDSFFALPANTRAILKRVQPYLEPASDLNAARADLTTLLQSDLLLFRVLAALLLSIHAYPNFDQVKELLVDLFNELDARSRLWVLFSFAVLIPNTPSAWVESAEQLTRRFVEENPALYYGDEPSLLTQFDVALLPLGLAYGKRGTGMPYLEALIRDGLSQDNWRQVETCVRGLGAVGFYYPQAVFQTLRAAISNFDQRMLSVLLRPLSTMRTLYFDQVDIFLTQIGADENYKRQVSAMADVALVRRYISWVGLYNNTVHSALFHPRIRRQITMSTLDFLADSPTPQELVTRFTVHIIRLSRETDYRLSEWLKRE